MNFLLFQSGVFDFLLYCKQIENVNVIDKNIKWLIGFVLFFFKGLFSIMVVNYLKKIAYNTILFA